MAVGYMCVGMIRVEGEEESTSDEAGHYIKDESYRGQGGKSTCYGGKRSQG